MTQTFTDLARERRADKSLHRFAVAAFAETAAEIMRENMTQLVQNGGMLRWLITTGVVLLVPFGLMVFQVPVLDPGDGVETVSWGPFDFVAAAVLLLGTGFLFERATRAVGRVAHRFAVGIGVAAALMLLWGNLAVGMIGSEDNPANLLYGAVLGVGAIGAAVARLEPAGMARTMFAMALAHGLVAFVALVAGLGPALHADAFFIGLWVASGLLFRHASVAPSPSR